MISIQKILIANRGEIASRVIRTCHEMGIQTVAVFSDADADATFALEADEAIHLGPAPSTESYLDAEKVIAAAVACGAQAIHPGYGFLAEDAHFARACDKAGLVFIGPKPDSIELLGSKIRSKELVAKADVPVVPGYNLEAPEEIEYPIMLKASAGGGGKGMQIVRSAAQLQECLGSAQRIAQSAFGDSAMLAEKYIESPRHIEIQIFGDKHGNLVHLHERECSIQRRHQKIIEETPAAGLSTELRDRIAAAAVAVAKAANYENAGTVEFIVSATGDYYFLEVNTRLQVEHPITEAVTGIDLVREQIRVAEGHPLSFCQQDIVPQGAAIECRLYAEDCDNDFLPGSGTLSDWHVPQVAGLRVDAGVKLGSEISIHYDPLIAKLITHGATRSEAIGKMQAALRGLSTGGLTSNRAFLSRVLGHPDFAIGKIDTGFLSNHEAELEAPALSQERLALALIAATCARYYSRQSGGRHLPHLRPGFRNNRWRSARVGFSLAETALWVGYECTGANDFAMQVPAPGIALQASLEVDAPIRSVRCSRQEKGELTLDIDGYRRRFRVTQVGATTFVLFDGEQFELKELERFPAAEVQEVPGACTAPMPAKVIKVLVKNGDEVKLGDSLIVLEAMKMEHQVKADADGCIEGLQVNEGDQVDGGELLVVVSPVG